MTTRSIALTLGLLLSCGAALGQYSGGVNIDFDIAAGTGSGQPSIVFGGAVGQGGYWTPLTGTLTSGTIYPIRDLGNSINAVNMVPDFATGGIRSVFAFNNAATSGDQQLLLDDGLNLNTAATGLHTFNITTFAPGLYRVATYAVAPDDASFRTSITVRTNQGFYGTQSVGGLIAANTYTQGVTHAVHDVPLAVNGPIMIDATTESGSGTINGIQIQRLSPTRLYVRSGFPTAGAGLSWAAPLTNLQMALEIAGFTPSVTEIWVARGTYYTDSYPFDPGDGTASFTLRSNLAVIGGFAGFEATAGERNLNDPANETVLDGHGIAGIIVRAAGTTGIILDGLTAAHGATGFSFSGTTATMTRCIARDNRMMGTGVLVDAYFGSDITIDRCAAVNNNSGGSGSILHLNGGGTLTVSNTLIANNDIGFNLMDASGGGSTYFRNCTIANNRGVGPSDYVRLYCAPTSEVRNCIFWGNTIGGVLATETGLSGVIDGVNWGNSSVTDNIIQGWTGTLGPAVDANIAADPRFVSPVAAGLSESPIPILGYAPGSRSPARDSGWNTGAGGTRDYYGADRIVDDPYMINTGFAGGYVDRGYIEASDPSAICPGDLGSAGGLPGPDGLRDNNDFIVFIDFFFTPDSRADLGSAGGVAGADGLLDNNDFIVFIDFFFTACP